jgi:hypothetical protein
MAFTFLTYKTCKDILQAQKINNTHDDCTEKLTEEMERKTSRRTSLQVFLAVFVGVIFELAVLACLAAVFVVEYDSWQKAKALFHFKPGRGFELHVTEQGWMEEFGRLDLDRKYCNTENDIYCGKFCSCTSLNINRRRLEKWNSTYRRACK